jgi:hypothetical protein
MIARDDAPPNRSMRQPEPSGRSVGELGVRRGPRMSFHDEIIARALEAVRRANRAAIVRAFVGSLSTRNLPARSAFGSYVVLQKVEAHPYRRSKVFSTENCAVCGLPPETDFAESEERVANYPFQVQHTDVQYAAFDLETFARRDVDEPTQESIDCLGRLLDALRALPADAQLTELGKSIGKAIKSNKHERMILLETFGYAGILCPKRKQHYGKRYVSYDKAESDQPKEYYKREWAYPVRFWTGQDGVNEKLVNSYFGESL